METCRYIAHRLHQFGINQYKIIESNEKSLIYKDVFENVSYENFYLTEIFVILRIKNKISTFILSPDTSPDLIDKIIEKSIANAFSLKFNWDNTDKIEQPSSSTNTLANIFEEFNVESYISQVKNEIDKVQKATLLTLNTVVNISSYQYRLITQESEYIQYHFSSECICLENKTFSQKALLRNFTSVVNLSDNIIEKLNERINVVPKRVDCSTILIKNIAVSQLVNSFANQFYADNVYLGSSIIKTDNIGKRIINNNICLNSLPYDGIIFDGEGSPINVKVLIKNGQLINLLSNNRFASYLDLKDSGNASFTSDRKITHQILKFNVHEVLDETDLTPTIIVNNIENMSIDSSKNSFTMIANCSDENGNYCTSLNFNIRNFLDNIYSTDKNLNLIDNVYCQDIVYKLKL